MNRRDYTIKLICLDLDGTLLTSGSYIDDYTLTTLNELYDNGYIIAVVSGRPLNSLKRVVKDLKHHWEIGMNGQLIKNVITNEIIKNPDLNYEDVSLLYNECIKFKVVCNIHDDRLAAIIFPKKHILFGIAYNLIERFRWIGKQKKKSSKKYFVDIKDANITNVGKVCFAGPRKEIQKLCSLIIDKYPKYVCLKVSPNWLEVMDKSISKGNAVKHIIDYHHFNKDNVLSFGDGENDISMLEASGYSCAMKDAMPSVKACATEVIGSHNEKAIGLFLNTFLKGE